MIAKAGYQRDPSTNLNFSIPGTDAWSYASLADRVANWVFEHGLHYNKGSFWYKFDLAQGKFNYKHPRGIKELKGGYFHRVGERMKRLRRGILWAEYDEEHKREQEKNKPTPPVEYVGNWNHIPDVKGNW